MSFTRHAQTLERPWTVYADFESTICQPCEPANELGSGAASSHEPMPEARRNALRKANSACAYLVCSYDSSKNQLWYAIGDDCVLQLLRWLMKTCKMVIADMRKNERLVMSSEEKKAFDICKCCHICGDKFHSDQKKVRDHDHRTGEFRGAAHEWCNINYFSNRYLPVAFHNLKGYDAPPHHKGNLPGGNRIPRNES